MVSILLDAIRGLLEDAIGVFGAVINKTDGTKGIVKYFNQFSG